MPSPLAGLDLNLLTALEALLETGSVTHAAKRIGVTQSAMSRTLGRLRLVLDDPLFVRQGRALTPTARALALHPPLRELITLIEHRILAAPAFDPATSTRHFRIVGADIMDLTLVPRLFRALREEAPHATMQVLRAAPEADQPAPDLIFAPRPLSRAYPILDTLHSAPLFTHRFTTLLRRDHPALEAPWTLDGFLQLDHVLVAPLGGSEGLVDRALAEQGLRRKVALWTTDFANLGPLLEQTDLVASLPDAQARFLGAHFALVERP
ncbi:MAG: LysR family transcriptional regulator, partial [Myxococcota bacterium]